MTGPTASDLQRERYEPIADGDVGLVEDADQAAMTRLEEAIRNRRCAVWVGAGMSRPIYPPWGDLLARIGTEANLTRGPTEREPAFVQRCKEALDVEGNGRYKEALIRAFAPAPPTYLCTDNHHQLLRAGFASYITTNFDRCIESANDGELIKGFHAWPTGISPTGLGDYSRRHLYHVHGVDCGQHPYPSTCGFPNVVLAATDYDRAYRGDDRLREFLKWLFRDMQVLFCGYGLEEEAFTEIVSHFEQSQAEVARNLMGYGARLSNHEHFALWRYQAHPASDTGVLHFRPADAAKAREGIRGRLGQHGDYFAMSPILYADGDDERHYYLNRVLRHLAQSLPYRSPREQP